MRLSWVELRDYRNHVHTHVDLGDDGVIVVAGPNGEGKTNLLEAMHFLYSLGSPRVSASDPLVRYGADAAYVRGEFETRDGRVLVEVEILRKGANRVQVDRSTVRRRRDLRRAVRVVLFGPFDLPIVIGDPARRRGFMDEVVVLLQPTRDTLTSSYERVLRQRNRLLKEHEGRGAPPELEAWDEQLIQTGAAVIRPTGVASVLGSVGLRPGGPLRAERPCRRRGSGVPAPAQGATVRRAATSDVARRTTP